MKYTHALAERRRALARSRAARGDLHAAVDEVIHTYQAYPMPILAGAAGLGFVMAQFRVGRGLIRAGLRTASGPAWNLIRQFLSIRS